MDYGIAMSTIKVLFLWLDLIFLCQNGAFSLIVKRIFTKVSGNESCNILKQLTIRSCVECLRYCEDNPDCEKISCHKGTKVCILCSSETISTQAVENIYDTQEESFKSKVSGKWSIIFLSKSLEDISPFCTAPYNPVLHSWWRLPKFEIPMWILLLACFVTCVKIHLTSVSIKNQYQLGMVPKIPSAPLKIRMTF